MTTQKLKQIIKEEISKILEISIPKGWSQNKIEPEPDDKEVYGGEIVASFSAPLDGWDNEHTDDIKIIKKDDGTYFLNIYYAFGGDENEGNFQTYQEAYKYAIKVMKDIESDWDINENYPSPSKPERETITIPKEPGTKPQPKRRTLTPPKEHPKTNPKGIVKETEQELLKKITAKFVQLKKK